jgi:hypothetical protein
MLPSKDNRGYHYYLDGLKVNGKRKRLFFTSEAEASYTVRIVETGRRKPRRQRIDLTTAIEVANASAATA